ncbi:hypothetical protein ACFL27_26715, partial [candidate division CSSED10-310 bacterium]
MNPGHNVVILSSDVVGHNMAGPGIRYLKMAACLASSWNTTLVVPEAVEDMDLTCHWIKSSDPAFPAVLQNASLIITQGYNFPLKPLLLSPARLIIDLYDPVP